MNASEPGNKYFIFLKDLWLSLNRLIIENKFTSKYIIISYYIPLELDCAANMLGVN